MFHMYTLVYHSAVQEMFLQKAALQRSSVELAVSYMEIYKDEVYDLFVNRESVRYLSAELLVVSAYHWTLQRRCLIIFMGS